MKLPEEWGEKGKYNLLYKYIYVIKVLQFYPIRRLVLFIGKEHEKILFWFVSSWPMMCIHGDKSQQERDWVLNGKEL